MFEEDSRHPSLSSAGYHTIPGLTDFTDRKQRTSPINHPTTWRSGRALSRSYLYHGRKRTADDVLDAADLEAGWTLEGEHIHHPDRHAWADAKLLEIAQPLRIAVGNSLDSSSWILEMHAALERVPSRVLPPTYRRPERRVDRR